jgi:acyl CoA:acetate/3-ketoacid CoA transferase alpha subunit
MDKLRTSPADAISDLPDGASIAVSGFGPSAGAPFSLLDALNERDTRDLCFVGNTLPPGAQTLVEAGRVRHLIVSFTARGGGSSPAEELMRRARWWSACGPRAPASRPSTPRPAWTP